jgi:hypothetical protein
VYIRSTAKEILLPLTIVYFVGLEAGIPPIHAAASFRVLSSHPRVLITSDDIDGLRHRYKNSPPFREAYRTLKNKVDEWSAPCANRYVIGYQIQALVFVSLIENYQRAYLNKLDKWLTNVFEDQGAVDLALSGDGGAIWGSADIILGAAIAYDGLYSALSSEKRIRYGTYLRDFQEAVIGEQGGMTRDASRSDYSNQFYYFDGMLAITGITLFNDGIDDSLALNYLNIFDDYLHKSMLPVVNQVGGSNGGWHEGLGYVDRAMTYFALELEGWRVGAGEDLFPQATGLKNLSKWLLYCTQPDGSVVNIGDVYGWPCGWDQFTGRRSVLLAARYNDGFSQYIANRITPINNRNWPYIIFYLLWYDPDIAEIDISTLDTAAHFDGIGWVSMRESWRPDATFAVFHSGNFYFRHQHLDQNSFFIFKHSPLAIDNGIYNVGAPRYKWATSYHNTILIGSPHYGHSLNDGEAGQTNASPMYCIADPEDSSSNKGDISHFESGKNFCYVIGDASNAYRADRLQTFIRKFLYIKPDYFIILDRIVVPSRRHSVRWLLQSENKPEVNRNEVKITNGSGRLFSKTLLPDNVRVSVNKVFPSEPRYKGGNYRTEIIPTQKRLEEYFLHVLWVADADNTEILKAKLVESKYHNFVGALFFNYVVLLSKNQTINPQLIYSVAVTGKINHLIADLIPKGSYEISQNGRPIAKSHASEGGMLHFDSDGGGRFDIRHMAN